jgi:predicted nucleotidyltransferase
MISDILPLNKSRLDILSELYITPLMAKELSDKLSKSIQVTHNTLTSMSGVLNKEQNIYSIKSEYLILIENLLIKNLLEIRLGKYYDILPYIKKFLNPVEMILFGSFYRGTYTGKSDIDIYIVSDIENKFVIDVENKLSRIMGRRIQIVNVLSKNHLTKKDNFSDLYNEINNSKKLGLNIPLNIL